MDRQERFELHSWAIVLRMWVDEPVIHLHDWHRYPPPANGDWTRCGRVVGMHTPWLPMKHALKFGRPCRDCLASLPQEGSA